MRFDVEVRPGIELRRPRTLIQENNDAIHVDSKIEQLKAVTVWVVGQFPVTRQTRHKATFATPLSENMNEDFTVELHVGLLGKGIGCSRPTKASNIGDGRFQPDAPNLRVAMTRGSKLLDLCSKTMLLNPRRK
ncbi:MAG TPA: hypothetical protein VF860_13070 [Candidatus Acidoferrales bacterium]